MKYLASTPSSALHSSGLPESHSSQMRPLGTPWISNIIRRPLGTPIMSSGSAVLSSTWQFHPEAVPSTWMKGQPLPASSSTGLKGHSGSTGRSQHLPTGAPSKSGDQKDDNRSSSFCHLCLLIERQGLNLCVQEQPVEGGKKSFLDLLRVPGVSKLNWSDRVTGEKHTHLFHRSFTGHGSPHKTMKTLRNGSSSRSWWWTSGPGVLQSMGSQRVGHDWMSEENSMGR